MAQHTVLAQKGTDAIVTATIVSKTCLCNTYLDTPPHKCGKCVDYKYLDDPFSDKEEDIIVIYCEKHLPLPLQFLKEMKQEAKKKLWHHLNGKEWEGAVKSEMDQLHKMGTWILVKRPTDAIPISNRWVFIKKFNKHGDLLKYTGRLVAKGCF